MDRKVAVTVAWRAARVCRKGNAGEHCWTSQQWHTARCDTRESRESNVGCWRFEPPAEPGADGVSDGDD
jgi:hypothetical protein